MVGGGVVVVVVVGIVVVVVVVVVVVDVVVVVVGGIVVVVVDVVVVEDEVVGIVEFATIVVVVVPAVVVEVDVVVPAVVDLDGAAIAIAAAVVDVAAAVDVASSVDVVDGEPSDASGASSITGDVDGVAEVAQPGAASASGAVKVAATAARVISNSIGIFGRRATTMRAMPPTTVNAAMTTTAGLLPPVCGSDSHQLTSPRLFQLDEGLAITPAGTPDRQSEPDRAKRRDDVGA